MRGFSRLCEETPISRVGCVMFRSMRVIRATIRRVLFGLLLGFCDKDSMRRILFSGSGL